MLYKSNPPVLASLDQNNMFVRVVPFTIIHSSLKKGGQLFLLFPQICSGSSPALLNFLKKICTDICYCITYINIGAKGGKLISRGAVVAVFAAVVTLITAATLAIMIADTASSEQYMPSAIQALAGTGPPLKRGGVSPAGIVCLPMSWWYPTRAKPYCLSEPNIKARSWSPLLIINVRRRTYTSGSMGIGIGPECPPIL